MSEEMRPLWAIESCAECGSDCDSFEWGTVAVSAEIDSLHAELAAKNATIAGLVGTIRKLNTFVVDILPQAGKLCIQDFGNLNTALLEAGAALEREPSSE